MPQIIVLTGIDGSGKTTQSQLLKEYLDSNIRVAFVQQFSSETKIGAHLISKYANKLIACERCVAEDQFHEKPAARSRIRKKHFLKVFAEFRIIITGLFHTWVKILRNYNSDIIIFDRYYFDDTNKAIWLYNMPLSVERITYKLVPPPDMLIYLNASPEIAWQREQDCNTTLEQHILKKDVYDNWFKRHNHKNYYEIRIENGIKEIQHEIVEIFKANYPTKGEMNLLND